MSQLSMDSQRQAIEDIGKSFDENLDTLRLLHEGLDSIIGGGGGTTWDPPASFRTAGTYVGRYEAFGGVISNDDRLFYSKREPIVKWLVYWLGQDIWDNWFKVVDPSNPNDESLDEAIQRVLLKLKAKRELTRSTVFERRYGTSILLCAYTGFGDDNWKIPIYKVNALGEKSLIGDRRLLQITPYSKTAFKVSEEEKDTSSIRYGLPLFYEVNRGDSGFPLKVHWTRVIHDAPQLDEHQYEGESVIDGIFDDAVGFRNARWGEYQTLFRVGSGFPVIYIPDATPKQINEMIQAGRFANLNARTYIVLGGSPEAREEFDFKGAQTSALNPDPYNAMAFASMSIGSRIPQDIFKGVSAGRITGSEVNERSYYKVISAEQQSKEPVLRELIDRFIDTGQIRYSDGRKGTPTKDYKIVWNYPSLTTERDQATIKYLEARTKTEMLEYKMVDEVRDEDQLLPLPDKEGEVVPGLKRLERMGGGSTFVPNPERQPEEGVVEDKDISQGGEEDDERDAFQDDVLEDALNRGRQDG